MPHALGSHGFEVRYLDSAAISSAPRYLAGHLLPTGHERAVRQ